MNVTLLPVPGNGQKTLHFANRTSVTVRDVINTASRTHGIDMKNREISVNGEKVSAGNYDTHAVWPGDLCTATGVVKGA